MGCPVKTVVKNGACAALINNRELAGEMIKATQAGAGFLPVSVKTRVGFTTVDMDWVEFLLGHKLDMLSIHGRTARQLSKVPADWDLIGQVREMRDLLCPATKIVGNGDVMNRAHGLKLANKYKLDGIMIGRGIFHDPFAFAEISPWEQWSQQQKLELFAKHIRLWDKTWKKGEYKFEVLKKFAKIYIHEFDGASELRAKFMEAQTADQALLTLSAAFI
jgi:tRNA-dihydrouridine synthase